MGFGGISIWQLLIILAIVVLLFGTKKLRNMGGDIGAAIKNFKSSMRDAQEKAEQKTGAEHKIEDASGRVFDAEVDSKDKDKV
jgi:sec-independent protein translocase protein TatA